ncbi:sugar phosphate isomerase/epimerase family protein [Devosia alba]|uniref:sugar phosphate isomerase/epimerase family protein n=1 Tax=Devosia alba TaxID=3152360 RepID=UPI003265D72E
MHLSLTSWSFPACTLAECAAISRALGINALDVGLFYRSALPKSDLLERPSDVAAMVKTLGVATPSYYHLFGDNPADRNLASRGSLESNLRDFRQVLRFADAVGIPSVFILPGVVNPGQSRAEAFAISAEALHRMVELTREHAASVSIEAHVHSLLESPADTLAMIEQVPGLKLTLDYAHFTCLGYRQAEIDVLAPHAAHVHLRQTAIGQLQTPVERGTINMPAQFGVLRDAGYGGALALEFVHQAYMGTLNEDVLTETVAMRDVWRAWNGED